jgi:multiple sugar transport system ATP-binding protein
LAHLRVADVVRRFGAVTALDGMSFAVDEGEFYCILGPSSAGKTTTLRAIAGLETLERGTISFAGQDITRAPVQGRGMAMIFQTFALYPHLTVRRNFAYPLERDGVGRAEINKRVGEIAELLRVGHTLDRKPDTLSGGEQQRVAIGRALVRRPRLLLLDEPLTNLDAKLRHDTRAEFKRLHRELGMTMLYATPDQLEALTMGQRVAVIRDGRVVQIETPRSLYERPQNTYVAGLVGAPAMNLLPGRVAGDAAGPLLDLGFAGIAIPAAGRDLAPGEPVVVGIRPHDVRLGGDSALGRVMPAQVHLREPLGDVTVIDLRLGDAAMKMVVREEVGVGLPEGSAIEVTIDPNDLHVFHAETGTRLA